LICRLKKKGAIGLNMVSSIQCAVLR
jgi:hypothetical protein